MIRTQRKADLHSCACIVQTDANEHVRSSDQPASAAVVTTGKERKWHVALVIVARGRLTVTLPILVFATDIAAQRKR